MATREARGCLLLSDVLEYHVDVVVEAPQRANQLLVSPHDHPHAGPDAFVNELCNSHQHKGKRKPERGCEASRRGMGVRSPSGSIWLISRASKPTCAAPAWSRSGEGACGQGPPRVRAATHSLKALGRPLAFLGSYSWETCVMCATKDMQIDMHRSQKRVWVHSERASPSSQLRGTGRARSTLLAAAVSRQGGTPG